MPEIYLCRTFLPGDQEAIAYAVKEDADDYLASKSLVRIQHKEAKEAKQEFEIEGEEIATMHYIPRNKFLAIQTEGGNKIFMYALEHNKLEKVLPFPSHVQALTTTEESLIVGVSGSLYIYDDSLILRQTLKIGDVVSGLAATDRFILCDVFTKADDRSQVTLFNYSTGTFLREIGSPRVRVKIKNGFLGVLDENTIFVAIPKQFSCDMYVYNSETGKQRNHFEIPNGDALFIFALLHGGIAVCCVKNSIHTVSVYSALDSSLLFSGISDLPLRFREDMLLFVAEKEKENLPVLAKGLVDTLGTLGLFPGEPASRIRDYAISYQALTHAAVEKLLPKP